MENNEKILLLAKILQDIRGSWGYDLDDRVSDARGLAVELGLVVHVKLIDEFYEDMAEGDEDGRTFRTGWESGGYIGSPHGLDERLIKERSNEFKHAIRNTLNYPEYSFDDWEQIENKWVVS